ncbi:MAG: lipocalin-like domain-containing protein [Pseudomonadota bacterium]
MATTQQMDADKFRGVWRLRSYEFQDEEGSASYPFGQNPRGLLMYDRSGMMSVQIIRHDRPLFPSEDMFGAAPDTVKAAFEGLNTYYGTFAVDESSHVVVHHVEGASMPNRTGSMQIRHYEFSRNELILKAPARLLDGKMLTGVLVWERVSSINEG